VHTKAEYNTLQSTRVTDLKCARVQSDTREHAYQSTGAIDHTIAQSADFNNVIVSSGRAHFGTFHSAPLPEEVGHTSGIT